jgi:hypothetical protein
MSSALIWSLCFSISTVAFQFEFERPIAKPPPSNVAPTNDDDSDDDHHIEYEYDDDEEVDT